MSLVQDETLFYGAPTLDESDTASVLEAMSSGWLNNGPLTKKFERDFAEYVGAKYAVAVTNGTAALYLAALLKRQKASHKKECVLTTPLTFVASAAAFVHAGYDVDFVDIDEETLNIDLNLLEDKLKNPASRKYVGIVPVHFAGLPINMKALHELAEKNGLWVIEDAAHALGTTFSIDETTYKCGGSHFSDMTIFSFHPVKHITTGEGGIITTNNKEIYDQLILSRSHSIEPNQNGIGYDIKMLSHNFRFTEMQAALGISQLARIDDFLARRRNLARIYDNALSSLPLVLPHRSFHFQHAYHLYILRLQNRDSLFSWLKEKDIVGQFHYPPVHKFSYFQNHGFSDVTLPVVEKYYRECISIPLHPSLSDSAQRRVIRGLEAFWGCEHVLKQAQA